MQRQSRLVRVFISSTFRDFIQERDELVKKVFPELRRRAKERFVEILEVDLRWGITEEQSESGETLRICLEEIDRCRASAPVFFVGLLGERYGWIPPRDYFKEDVLDDPKFEWVKDHIAGKSVTELEILHGVLRNEAMRDKSFFYFRNDGYHERHWDSIARYHAGIEPPIEKVDFTNAKATLPEADSLKQSDLKQRVRDVSFKWKPTEYETPLNLADRVLEDLWSAIDQVFPVTSVPDALVRESLEHQVFMDSRTKAYVEREGLFQKLDAFIETPPPGAGELRGGEAEDDDAPAHEVTPYAPAVRVVLGESGSGKSAFLAAWLAPRIERVAFFHFTGATPASVSGSSLLRRLLSTLRQSGVVPASETIPSSDEAMAAMLPSWLDHLSAKGGGILLFDAINQLGSARDRELWWWPEQWPANVRVVFSTLPGESLREMKRRGWMSEECVIHIPLLQPGEKRSIMNLYLKLFARTLEPRLQEKILAAPQSASPLFLRTVLEQLRLRSRHEELDRDLDFLLQCHDPAALFVRVLQSLERDFSPPSHPDLVHRALGLMGAAQRGLSENEILQLLSPARMPAAEPMARHYWAPLYLALEDSLVSREGQLGFFHDFLRQAVWREYLDEDHELEAARTRLAEPAIRWNEPEAFGTSLRAYGFEFGIRHLLDVGRFEEAAAMMLETKYRHSAVESLRQAISVQQDVARVRHAVAREARWTPEDATVLTVLALTGENELELHLRRRLGEAAGRGDWEEALGIAGASEDNQARLLLVSLALIHNPAGLTDTAGAQVQEVASRWADATGKPEWEEVLALLPSLKR